MTNRDPTSRWPPPRVTTLIVAAPMVATLSPAPAGRASGPLSLLPPTSAIAFGAER
jgi:hypothetical protein